MIDINKFEKIIQDQADEYELEKQKTIEKKETFKSSYWKRHEELQKKVNETLNRQIKKLDRSQFEKDMEEIDKMLEDL